MKWQIGDVEILQIVEFDEAGELIQDTIKNATPENLKKIDWLYPDFIDDEGNFKSLVQSFLVRSNGQNILVDTCNGNGKERPNCPTWGNLNTDFLEKLRSLGVTESEIDIVVSTHLHFDHIGWNTRLENGSFIPTFPNAKYLFVKEEFDYWKAKPEKEMEDDKIAFDDSVRPIIEAGLSQIVESDHKIDQNISLISAFGHTPGHICILIESRGKRTIISGDFLHHPCQIAHPEWTMDADTLSEKALETRKKILNEIADTETLLIGSHFADPVAGYVKRSGDSYIFKHE